MNLLNLFETQKKLDARIVEEKGLEGQDLLPQKILALLTELGELSNEWRGFKFWSEKNVPVVRVDNPIEHGNPMLEEYVDNLHFILSIGNDIKTESSRIKEADSIKAEGVIEQFIYLNRMITTLDIGIYLFNRDKFIPDLRRTTRDYERLFLGFIGLGEMLGFTWDQIETAYYEKNKINHERQNTNY